jgi:hypothetical protein
MHHFWQCPVARALLDEMNELLPVSISREQLWLVRSPPGMHQLVWDVVCLAAVSALEMGRRLLLRRRPLAGAPPLCVLRVCAECVADFWARLRGFVALGRPPRGWGEVSPVHPFLAASWAGDVLFRGPPDLNSPPASP